MYCVATINFCNEVMLVQRCVTDLVPVHITAIKHPAYECCLINLISQDKICICKRIRVDGVLKAASLLAALVMQQSCVDTKHTCHSKSARLNIQFVLIGASARFIDAETITCRRLSMQRLLPSHEL
jgi:hypothetical protein